MEIYGQQEPYFNVFKCSQCGLVVAYKKEDNLTIEEAMSRINNNPAIDTCQSNLF